MTYPGSPPYQISSKSVMLSEFCYKQLEGQGHTTKRCIFLSCLKENIVVTRHGTKEGIWGNMEQRYKER
jgi:hypothetical protein